MTELWELLTRGSRYAVLNNVEFATVMGVLADQEGQSLAALMQFLLLKFAGEENRTLHAIQPVFIKDKYAISIFEIFLFCLFS